MQATEDLTYDEAVKRLRHEELRRENIQDQQGTAMSTTSKRGKKDFKKEDKKETRKCFTCGKIGHIQKDCSIYKREQKKESGEDKNTDKDTKNVKDVKESKASAAYDLEQLEKMLFTHEPTGKSL